MEDFEKRAEVVEVPNKDPGVENNPGFCCFESSLGSAGTPKGGRGFFSSACCGDLAKIDFGASFYSACFYSSVLD